MSIGVINMNDDSDRCSVLACHELTSDKRLMTFISQSALAVCSTISLSITQIQRS